MAEILTEQDNARQVVEGIVAAWQRADADALGEYYHQDIVVLGPGWERRCHGRAAAIEGDRAFLDAARIDSLELGEYMTDVAGSTAVVTYPWAMTYTMDGVAYEDRGRDLMVLTREEDRWWVVWRAMTLDAA